MLPPFCDRCFKNDRVKETGLRRNGAQFVMVYWCERCRHNFSVPSSMVGGIYYDGRKAHMIAPGSKDEWIRVKQFDIER